MKKFFYPLLLLMAVTLTACSDDDDDVVIAPTLSVDVNVPVDSDGDYEVAQDETIEFRASVASFQEVRYVWTLNGTEVAKTPTYKFEAKHLGDFQIVVKAIANDGGVAVRVFDVEVHGKYKNGTFVLNEGNMSDGTGVLTFISPKGIVTDSVYFKENGSFVGNATQDLWIENNKMYMISQNGSKNGSDGILVVANAETMKKEAVYNQELSALSNTWPSHVAVVDGQLAYIRDNNGINLFDLVTKKLTFIKGTEGAAKNRMVEIDDKIYAIAGNSILALSKSAVVGKYTMEGNISGILETDDDNLWVACTTTPAQICKVNAVDGKIIEKHTIAESGVGAGWGATPGISAKGDTIYFSNATTKIYRHIFSQNKTEFMTDVKEHVDDANVVYNNLGVDPVSGEVYINTMKGFGEFNINDITVFDFDKQKAPVASYKNHTAFPAGIFFTESF